MSDNILLEVGEIDYVRETLTTVHMYLHARDIADSALKLMPEPRLSSLTREVADCLQVVENAYKAFLLQESDRERFQVDPPLPYEVEDDGEE